MIIKLKNKKISSNHKPFIVAEMSGNHNQSKENAFKIVDAAAKSGADAIKLQTYTAETMTLNLKDKEFFISDKKSLWKGQTLSELYSKGSTPWDWHKEIINYANNKKIICFSTPFDNSSVDFLETLNIPIYKIASFELTDLPLIKKVAQTKKPIIISTGMGSIDEIKDAVNIVKQSGNDFILLKCTSTYPAKAIDSNVLTIPELKKIFNCEVGLSDHTKGIGTAIAAVSHGACLIEKHFTLDRKLGGIDSDFSLEPHELKSLVIETRQAHKSLGKIFIGPTKSEELSLKYRRSLYCSKDIKKGSKVTKNNIKSIRPGFGISPKYYDELIGKKVRKNIKKGTPIKWNLFS